MQKYYQRIKGSQEYLTNKPDILIQGAGVGYNEKGLMYRQSGDLYGHTPLIAKFRPAGWTKSYEYVIKFNDCSTAQDEIKIELHRKNNKGETISVRDIMTMSAKVHNKLCPFCNYTVIFDSNTLRWNCSQSSCQFSYTADTCQLMYNDFKATTVATDVNKRKFNNFNSLNTLRATGDMVIKRHNYQT